MKNNTFRNLIATAVSLISLYGCSGDPAFTANSLQLGNGVGSGGFTAGEIEIIDDTLPIAGDSTVIKFTLVDKDNKASPTSLTVTISSACISSGASTVSPATITNTTGYMTTTYTNNSCSGDDDIIVYTNTTPVLTASGTISTGTTTAPVTPPTAGTTLLFGSGPNTSTFTNGDLDIQSTTIDQAGSTLITAKIVDSENAYLTSTEAHTVTFSSDCVGFGQATLSASTASNTAGNPAIFQVTYTHTDNACASDNVTASTTLSGATTVSTATGTISIVAGGTTPTPAGTTYRIGNGIGNGFTNGALNIQSSSLTTGGSTSVTANIVDENGILDSTNSNTVSFQVLCENNGSYTLSNTSLTNSTGTFTTTFTDVSCNGTVGINAFATLNGTTATAYNSLSIGTATTAETYSIGELTGGGFVAGQMNLSSASLNSGDSSQITVHVTDSGGSLYTTADTEIVFNSTCVGQGKAIIVAGNGTSTTSTGTTGTATASYQATGCVGTDSISATASSLNGTRTATGSIAVTAAAFNTIKYVSTSPATIGIKGMGLDEITNVKFKLVDESSGPVEGLTVNFSLSNSSGGISLTNATAVSGSNGEVTAVVRSGTVQANFVVTASTTVGATTYVASSNTISVQNAIPAQNGLSLVVSSKNPEAYSIVQNISITAYVSDRNSNPVPDGNVVNFIAECGSIGPSCSTTNGSCSVTWTSTPINCIQYADATDKGKVSIMAYIDGEESFLDADADGQFTSGTDTVLTNNGEAYMDRDNSGGFNAANDTYQDFNSNRSYDDATAMGAGFNGALCISGCGTTNRIHVFKTVTIIAATSEPIITASRTSVPKTANTGTDFSFSVTDSNGNIMPAGTKITLSTTTGTIDSTKEFVVPSDNPISALDIADATLIDDKVKFVTGTTEKNGVISIVVESPSGAKYSGNIYIE